MPLANDVSPALAAQSAGEYHAGLHSSCPPKWSAPMPTIVSAFCVTEVGEDQYVVFPPSEIPKKLKPPKGLFGIYEITGELRIIHKNLPPKGPANRKTIQDWLMSLKANGCYIRPSNYTVTKTGLVNPG